MQEVLQPVKQLNKRQKIWIFVSAIMILILFFAAVMVVQLHDYGGARIGMKYDELCEIIPESEHFRYYYYIFYTNSCGNYVVAHLNNSSEIIELKCYLKLFTNNSPRTFRQIKSGASPFEVVAMVGIPYDQATFGMFSCVFSASDGSNYVIYWIGEETETGYGFIVDSVVDRGK